MRKKLKQGLQDILLHFHRLFLHFRVAILPNHYYSPVPDINELRKRRSTWARESLLAGIQVDLDVQCHNLITICRPFENEFRGNHPYRAAVAEGWGQGFGYIEAQALHGVVRHFKPRRIVEVGAGVSTYCMLKAVQLTEKETGNLCEITCIEPFPSPEVQQAEVKLIPTAVQSVPEQLFQQLGTGDLLFIDSSHVVKTGSDVVFLILEVLPKLKPGVLIHFHDIFLPYDYRPEILDSFFDWQETSLLQAFLIGNSRIEILFCMSQLHHERPDSLRQAFPEYRPIQISDGLLTNESQKSLRDDTLGHFPASIFLRVQS